MFDKLDFITEKYDELAQKVSDPEIIDKLEDLVKRLDEVMQELSEPDVVSDQNRFRNLMKEQNELAPIVEKYKEYKEAKQTIEDSVEMLEEEHDEEMRELLKEELSEAKKNVEQYEEELFFQQKNIDRKAD